MTVLAAQTLAVSLEADCGPAACSEFAWRMHKQLDQRVYTRGVSLMEVPASVEAWRSERRTARKRAARAFRLGYRFAEIDRSRHNQDIHQINTSLYERQGRRMSDGYLEPPTYTPLEEQPCQWHRVHTYGVLHEDTLRAYLTLYRVGELALVSSILGHGDHLRDDIMYLLFEGAVADQADRLGFFYYNRFDSGTEGLRYFKTKLGFRAADIDWRLA